jgi:FixJ family two-component response regulator
LARHWRFDISEGSVHEDEGVREQALRAGAVGFLQKPFDDQQLLEIVSVALGSSTDDDKADGSCGI